MRLKGCSKGCLGVGFNAGDHAGEAIGALGGEVFLETQLVEIGLDVERCEIGGGAAVGEGEQDGDQALDDVAVAFALEG